MGVTMLSEMYLLLCVAASTRHHQNIHAFETKVLKSVNKDESEKFKIAKREDASKRSFPTLKRYDITRKEERKTGKEHSSKTPKNVIEPANAFSHLSDLLGLKGSFIPSQSKQRWMEDEDDNVPNPNENFNNYVKQLDQHSQEKKLEPEKGILPLDISPEQAALITSTADRNSQRKKFLQWEKEGGSMDTMHFPSRYIKGERSIEGDGIDSDASKRVATEEPPSKVKIPHGSRVTKGTDGSQKQIRHMQGLLKDLTLNDIGNKDKKGFLGYLSDQLGASEESHIPKSELTSHAFLATAFHSTNEQPLTHDMINKLQLDPAWDAMEANILSQNGKKAMPMPIPVSKIDREMMPPLGEPVGQAYLPNHRQPNLVSNFHKAAGFMTQPLRGDLHPSSYYSHFQPMDQGIPQTLNIGGSLVHAVGDPWKNLKQMTYDHADDNFPLPSASQQSAAQTASSSPSATASAVEDSDEGIESVGRPLTKVKAQHMKGKETSKVIESSNGEDAGEKDVGVKIGKVNQKKKPNLILLKGKKFGKKQRNRNSKVEAKEGTGKHDRKVQEGRKVKAISHVREENTVDDEGDTKPGGMREDAEDKDSKKKPQKLKGPKQGFDGFENGDDGQGPRFSQQESNFQEKQPISADEERPYMVSGNYADRSKSKQNENTGRYITHKFVNFLSDVAQHLNVDKLSIAEQLVKDVEESKKKKDKNNEQKVKENKAINEILQRLQTKRREVEHGHGFGSKHKAMDDGIGSFRIRRKQPTVIKYIWNKGISVLKET